MHTDDTIVAIATPPGRGGIGVARLSGPDSVRIACAMLRLRRALAPAQACFGDLIDPASGARLDEVVATYFRAPQSYTAEDVIEISCHGAPVLLEHVVRCALAAGARLAEPGEFTRRAFLNGRINLTQAEAVRDLIESQTLYQAKVAAQQLEGALSKRVAPIKQQLVNLIALLEAGIDFAEDDVAVLPPEQIMPRITAVENELRSLLASFRLGHIVHQGISLAIVGRPNVGKSSLFNRLVERERAIVTDVPGTTRDAVTETVALNGVPLRLIDTAGIRESSDIVERIGIERSYEALADADLVLLVFESGRWEREDDLLLQRVAARSPLLVANKSDLQDDSPDFMHAILEHDAIACSALTGDGISQLRDAIWKRVAGASGGQVEPGALTNARHEQLVRESLTALSSAHHASTTAVPHEMLLIDLYNTLRPLDALTGETTPDDILNLIFSTFCVGK